MKILTHIHAYPPKHNAGAEWMLHSILRWFVAHGDECVVCTESDSEYTLDGVVVIPDNAPNRSKYYTWSDIVITHLGRAGKAWNCAQTFRKPIIHICHNDFTNRLTEVKADFHMVYNTVWMWKSMMTRGYRDGFVLHPPIWFDDYHTETSREYITLVNCNENKGGHILVELAEEMPERKFMGVIGQYGDQIRKDLPNLIYTPHTADMKRVYAKSRIVIMPSSYESYGRVAVEAMCSGIPVICNGTPGLMEALGDLGIYAGLDPYNYAQEICSLDEEKRYNDLSLRMISKAKQYDERNEQELTQFSLWMRNIKREYKPYYNQP